MGGTGTGTRISGATTRNPIVGPLVEPVSLAELKYQLRLESTYTDEDTLLAIYIKAVRQHVEDLCGPLITQTWVQYETGWPAGDDLPLIRPRVQTISSVTYTNTSGASSTFAAASYRLNSENEYKPKIVLLENESWPTDGDDEYSIAVQFICGYGDTATYVPESLRLFILFWAAFCYEKRLPVEVSTGNLTEFPFVGNILANYRMWGF